MESRYGVRHIFPPLAAYAHQRVPERLLRAYPRRHVLTARRASLAGLEKNAGGEAKHESYQSRDATSRAPTFIDLGITRSRALRWQAIASAPQAKFPMKRAMLGAR